MDLWTRENIKNLEKNLIGHKENLIGDWIKNHSSYDVNICKILSMKEVTVRTGREIV